MHAQSSLSGLRERAVRYGLDSLAEQETLSLFLSRSLPKGSGSGAYAQALLQRYGTLAAVVGAPTPELVGELGEEAAIDLKLLHEATRRIAEAPIRHRSVISSWSALLAYLKLTLAHEPREQFRVLFLDKKNQLIADEVMNHGTVDHAPVYPREVVRRALELSAAAVILVHNHPSGDPTPSQADIDMTRQVEDACRTLRIGVHDHIVVGAQGTASMKALGLF